MTSLQEICNLITDGKHGDCRDENNSGYYFISCKDVKDGWIDYCNARQITKDDFLDTHRRTQLEPGDIVITNSGTIGRMAIVQDTSLTNHTTFQKSVAIIKPKHEKVLTNWLFYYFNANKEILVSRAGGTAQKNLLLRDLRAFDLSIPPRSDQQKIAAILSAYDNLIENNTWRIKILEEMAQAIYREWFVNFRFPGHEGVRMVESEQGPVPEGWEIRELFDMADVTYGFPFKSNIFTSEPTDKPVIRIRNILNDYTDNFTTESVSDKYVVNNGDLLVGMDGDFHMGKWAGGTAYLNQRVVRFRPKEKLPNYYLFLALEKPIQYFDSTITGTTVAHLSDKDLKSIRLLIPDDQLLKKINEIFNPLFLFEMKLKIKNANLHSTRDLLIQRLFNEEIDVSRLDIRISISKEYRH
jgi:type I restriction enzyme S subunit